MSAAAHDDHDEHRELDELDGGASTPTARLVARAGSVRPFLIVGSASVVAGGIVAAITRPTDFELGSWLAAYLVLVGGVAQIALGVAQALLAREAPDRTMTRWELVSWNLALLLTILGSLVGVPVLTTLGAIALLASLGLFLVGVRHSDEGSNGLRLLYRCVIVIVLVSTPVGVALSWIRHG